MHRCCSSMPAVTAPQAPGCRCAAPAPQSLSASLMGDKLLLMLLPHRTTPVERCRIHDTGHGAGGIMQPCCQPGPCIGQDQVKKDWDVGRRIGISGQQMKGTPGCPCEWRGGQEALGASKLILSTGRSDRGKVSERVHGSMRDSVSLLSLMKGRANQHQGSAPKSDKPSGITYCKIGSDLCRKLVGGSQAVSLEGRAFHVSSRLSSICLQLMDDLVATSKSSLRESQR
jgi:hypothetical protein